jgi:hypothetical protein
MIAITGCPRAGTGFASKYLNIGHEYLSKNGISSWCLVGKDALQVPFGISYKELIAKHPDVKIYHQVREPLKCISSITTIGNISWAFFSNYIKFVENESKLRRAMKIYYEWNKKAETITKETYQVEKINEIFGERQYNNKNYNTRNHKKYNWDDFYNTDEILTTKIKELSQRYGY